LTDVEDAVDSPELRQQLAQVRDRARLMRADFKRHSKQPKFDLVQSELITPLVEVRDRIQEELLRKDSRQLLVPLDRDPVPARYSELVRQYYEKLGTGEK